MKHKSIAHDSGRKKIQIKKVGVLKKTTIKPLADESADFGKKYLSLLMEGKAKAKQELLCKFNKKGECENSLGLNKTPLMIIFMTDLNGKKELIKREVLFKILEGMLVTNCKMIVIDTDEPSDIDNLGEVNQTEKRIIWYNPISDSTSLDEREKEIDRMLLAADMALVFNNHIELLQLAMNYGVVVLGDDSSPMLENYDPNRETGNSFTYKKKDEWGIFACIIRALETFKFPFDWRNIVRKTYK